VGGNSIQTVRIEIADESAMAANVPERKQVAVCSRSTKLRDVDTGVVLSVNIAEDAQPTPAREGWTGIGKHPCAGPVRVAAPGPKGIGGSGLSGDVVYTKEYHGGDDQAVYAYAREDLDWWAQELGRDLPGGLFGENLTVQGLDLTGALVGERWRVGAEVVLEVTCPRVPCQTFAFRMGEPHWVKRFTERGATGAYLRVLQPGEVRAGDRIEVLTRPGHAVTMGFYFHALMTQPGRYAELVAPAGAALPLEARELLAEDAQVLGVVERGQL
jgi:MOSC domain-containing protein YiiM